MKTKQLALTVILAVILLFAWVLALKASTSTEIIDTQNELTAKADTFAEKALYIRAIPLYQEALGYDTEQNSEIESKLLQVYFDSGKTEQYLDLAEARLAAKTITEDEVVTAAKLYLGGGHLKSALTFLETAMLRGHSDSILALYEANRYAYTMRSTGFQIIQPTADNRLMPAFDGEAWYYADDLGRKASGIPYEYASPFNDSGYACVKENGVYYTIISTGEHYGVDEIGMDAVLGLTKRYLYAQKDGKWYVCNGDFQKLSETMTFDDMTMAADGCTAVCRDGKWGVLSDSGEMVLDFIFEDVRTNSLGAAFSDGAGMMKYQGLWYLSTPAGKKLCETGFADAKAPESDGLIAVADENGKWGFINRSGELVIDCQYADAKSFSDHVGAVKTGDRWSYISETGTTVIDLPMEQAEPFHNGCAQVVITDQVMLLELSACRE